jgi:hypothetical protein
MPPPLPPPLLNTFDNKFPTLHKYNPHMYGLFIDYVSRKIPMATKAIMARIHDDDLSIKLVCRK